jgi:PAS domain S-box-containing protein
MPTEKNYLEQELYNLIKTDDSIFTFIQEGSLDGIWYWDLEKPENEWMSPKFWTNFGYDPAEKKHLSSEWQNMIFPEDLKVATENFKKHCENPNHPYDQIVRYRKKDGGTAWVRCRGIAIRDKNGKPVRMLGAHNDITELKASAMQIEELNNFMTDRELKMVELKQEVDALLKELGRKPKYIQ